MRKLDKKITISLETKQRCQPYIIIIRLRDWIRELPISVENVVNENRETILKREMTFHRHLLPETVG